MERKVKLTGHIMLWSHRCLLTSCGSICSACKGSQRWESGNVVGILAICSACCFGSEWHRCSHLLACIFQRKWAWSSSGSLDRLHHFHGNSCQRNRWFRVYLWRIECSCTHLLTFLSICRCNKEAFQMISSATFLSLINRDPMSWRYPLWSFYPSS